MSKNEHFPNLSYIVILLFRPADHQPPNRSSSSQSSEKGQPCHKALPAARPARTSREEHYSRDVRPGAPGDQGGCQPQAHSTAFAQAYSGGAGTKEHLENAESRGNADRERTKEENAR